MRHLILGTAGHVDHGKTELVKALTGRDTDRLKEEKERGISIELGFAPLALDDDVFFGVIDVPGHERFVKQMVSGAGGIDTAMLLVAADESVMPQTEEHMEVLSSLGLRSGVVVIAKKDLASDDMLAVVRDDIADLVAGTFLENAPIVETSAKTGEGIDALRKILCEIAAGVRDRDASGPFRLPVDRVFHQRGIGVVVTGSGYSGTVRVGDTLELLPARKTVRVRELQSFGERREEGFAGERLAVALQGVKLDEVSRGDVIATPSRFNASDAVDLRVRLATYDQFEIKNRERVRVHHGAREVLGRIILLESDVIASGEDGLSQLRLESQLVCAKGDALVLRKYSPARVAGGGTVIVPRARRHKRRDAAVLERLRVEEQGSPVDILLESLRAAGLDGVAVAEAEPGAADALCAEGRAVVIGDRLFHAPGIDALGAQVEGVVAQYLAARPLQWGVDKEELRQRLHFPHATALFNKVLDALAATRAVFVRENRVRVGSESVDLPPDVRADVDALERDIHERGLAFPSRTELGGVWRGRHELGDALQYLKDAGVIVDLGEGVVHRNALASCVEALRELFERHDAVSVAVVKDTLGLSRKHAIPLLEYLDRQRITARVGNERIAGPAFDLDNV